jgi:hypothetical protein
VKLDFSSPILDIDGQPVADQTGTLTLARMATEALLGTLMVNDRPEQLIGEVKTRNAALALRIHAADAPIDVAIDDAAVIKDRIGRMFVPLYVMRAWALLEGDAV